jgi:hypothetical protein
MTEQEPKIEIFDKQKIEIPDLPAEFMKRFDKLFILVIGAMLIGFITLLVMVAGMVIDTWRFDSSVYKETQQNNIEQQNLILQSLKELSSKIK